MATGLTAPLYEGKPIDLRGFALRCARQMGACIMQRDDPTDEPPKLREKSDFYGKRLAEANARLAWLQGLNERQADYEADAAWRADADQRMGYAIQRAAIRVRYEAMLAEVEAWEPPTAQHVGLKELMASQLRESIDFDCGDHSGDAPRLSGAEWLAQEIKKAHRDVGYYGEQVAAEEARVTSANQWITALYAGFGEEPPR